MGITISDPTRVPHTVSDPVRPPLSPLLLLVVGVTLIAFTFMRYSVPEGERVPTLYATTGEIVPLVALAFCVLAVALAIVNVARGIGVKPEVIPERTHS